MPHCHSCGMMLPSDGICRTCNPGPVRSASEQVFFDTPVMNASRKRVRVQVTQARFVVGEQTFAMAGITSVRHKVVKRSKVGALLGLGLGLAFLILGTQTPITGQAVSVLGVILLIIGTIALGYALQEQHTVALTTASGETTSIVSKDRGSITSIVSALNEAIIARG